MTELQIPVTRYVLIFLATTVILTAAVVAFTELTGVELNSGVNVGVAIASALAAGQRFVKDNSRLPSKSEKHRLATYSLLSSLAASAIAVGAWAWLADGSEALVKLYNAISGPILALATAVTLVVYYFIIWLSYGWVLRKISKHGEAI